jgi:heme-degrading monooxygenase HmoA
VYEVVWEFRPARHREREFESAYGPTGPWVELFRRDRGYLGTELIAPRDPGGWYRTIDRWESAAAYERFRRSWAAEYAALDEACAALTSAERAVSAGGPAAGVT